MSVVRVDMQILRISLFLMVLGCQVAFAQVGNEWINFSQPYFKVPVAREGIYKLGFADLQSAGFPVGANPANIQLFHRGVEQAIYVAGEVDGILDPADFIEFYGNKNDGTLDAGLYLSPEAQPHTRYNLFSDTTSYFLTVGTNPGKRMTDFFELNTSGLPPVPSQIDAKQLLLTSEYSKGLDYDEGPGDFIILKSNFDVGEGWTGARIVPGNYKDYSLAGILQGVPAQGPPTLEVLVVGRGPRQHQSEIYVGTSPRLIESFTLNGYESHKTSQSLLWSDVAPDGSLLVRIKNVGTGGAGNEENWISTSYIVVKYPQQVDMGGAPEKTITLPADVTNKSFIQIQNPPPTVRLFDITDPANIGRLGTTLTTTLNAIVPATSASRTLYASSASLTPGIKAVKFREIFPSQHDYIIISNSLLRKPALGYSDPVSGYAAYRASDAGGGYDTLTVNIQQLYDQFNYGESSPLAIYHFMRFLANSKIPKYLLLIGKGLDVELQYYRNTSSPSFSTYKDFVPFAGSPGSDIIYTAGLAGTSQEPAVPTGRIPALKAEDVAAYLDKVKEMEALPYNALWRKQALHLSGGIYSGEPQLFKFYMEGFQSIAEDYHFGGRVSAIAKYSTETVQSINVAEQVNNGLGLLTYLGHSSTSTTDFQIGNATDPVEGYHNKGRYPVLLFNGCYTGASYYNYTILGEDWVLAKDRGAIGFIAHSAYGYLYMLRRYSEMFYTVGLQDSLFSTGGLGNIQKETARRYIESNINAQYDITQIQQMVLLGDPAVKLFGAQQPDLEINESNVSIESFDGQPLTVQADSFAVRLVIRNFGQARKGNFRVEIQRTLNDNSTLVYDTLYPAVKYSDTLTFVIHKGKEIGFGNNTFQITINPDDVIPELTKTNNVATKTIFIPFNITKNLFPTSYAIVSAQTVSLAFQTTDDYVGVRDFLVELDTVPAFDSPFKMQAQVAAEVLAKHSFTVLTLDTVAYYWRTRLAQPLTKKDSAWTQSSFTYIADGPEGWAQVDFPQYLENQTVGLVKDTELKRLRFLESVTPVSITTYGGNHPAPFTDVSVKIENAEFNLYGPGYDCRDNSINLIAFDRKSTVPYTAVKFEWYNRAGRNCGRKPWVINSYVPSQMVTGNNDDIIQYVDNVAAGDSVIIYSIGDAQFSAWPVAAKVKLGELGIAVSQIDALQDGEPVIIFGRKGTSPGSAQVIVSTSSPKDQQALHMDATITGGYTSGVMHSTHIGAASEWGLLHNKTTGVNPEDQVTFDIVGIKPNGLSTVILQDVVGDQDLSFLNAVEYPQLQLTFKTEDETNLTTAQLDQWLVTYTPAPEGLLYFANSRDRVNLLEGAVWIGNYGYVNISNKSFSDSLLVRFAVFNQTQRTTQIENIKIKAPEPGDTTRFSLSMDTRGQAGLNDVEVFVNPHVLPEQYFDNNVLSLLSHVQVERDLQAPVLDVTFDGDHLIDGDFVSPNPLIEIMLWDENKYLLKTDTLGIRIFMTSPCEGECDPAPILFANEAVTWQAATDSSEFKVTFRPKNLEDGEYKLRIEAADVAGNKSGLDTFKITFQVRHEVTVAISDAYPNPFSESVLVNVVISGSQVPGDYEFLVVDVNGQVHRRLSGQELPPFHIGTNVLVWDGTGAGGSLVPNGVYVYKLSLVMGEKKLIKVGKLVLVR